MYADIQATCSTEYKIPKDPINKLAISIQYFNPYEFTSMESNEYEYESYLSVDKWGKEADYKELIDNFISLKDFYIDKGIPVIITEVGVLTEENKEIDSIREYLYALFSLSNEYEGIMACLWDTSNRNKGKMNYYNRETDEWYDKKYKIIFIKFQEEIILNHMNIII